MARENRLRPVLRCHVSPVFPDDTDVDTHRRTTTRCSSWAVAERTNMILLAQQRSDGRDLRHAVQLDEDRTETIDELAANGRGRWATIRTRESTRSTTGFRRWQLVEHPYQLRRHQERVRGTDGSDRIGEEVRIETTAVLETDRRTDREARDDRDVDAGVVRNLHQVSGVGGRSRTRGMRWCVLHHRGMVEEHSFRAPGRAARVDDARFRTRAVRSGPLREGVLPPTRALLRTRQHCCRRGSSRGLRNTRPVSAPSPSTPARQ